MKDDPIRDLFTFCSGADKNVLAQSPDIEQKKHRNIGAIVLLTAIFASLSGGYALFTIFDDLLTAAAFGLLWGVMIFALDRYLVSSMKKLWRLPLEGREVNERDLSVPKPRKQEKIDEEEGYQLNWAEPEESAFDERKNRMQQVAGQISDYLEIKSVQRELLQALPRLFLAFIIAVVISKPLEMKIFEKEINQILLKEKNALRLANQEQIGSLYDTELGRLRREIERLQNQVIDKEVETNALYQSYIAEAEGSGGTMLRGKGPIYREKRAKYDQSFAELQELRVTNKALIERLQAEIDQIEDEFTENVEATEPVIQNFDGLQARIEAIGKMDNPWPSIFIMLLFLAIETAPIFAKVLSPIGVYDRKLLWMEHREDEISMEIAESRGNTQFIDDIEEHIQQLQKEIEYTNLERTYFDKKIYFRKYKETQDMLLGRKTYVKVDESDSGNDKRMDRLDSTD